MRANATDGTWVTVAVKLLHSRCVPRTLALAAALLIGTAGCSDSTGSDARDVQFDGSISEYQREVLTDGVTWSEYEQATLATMRCIEEQGIRTYGPYPENGGRFLSFDYGGFDTDAPEAILQAADQSVDECVDSFLSVVADVYSKANQPTLSELEELATARLECARNLGFTDVPEDPKEFPALVLEHSELAVCLDPTG